MYSKVLFRHPEEFGSLKAPTTGEMTPPKHHMKAVK